MARVPLLLAVLVALLVGAPAASAAPGDPLPENLAPANGATTPANAPVTLSFTCPAYRQSPSEDTPQEAFVGYAVRVAKTPDFSGETLGTTVQRGATPGQCTASVNQPSRSEPLTEAGTYYWQVSRFCFCGESESELGPVSSFTIAAAQATMKTAAPAKPYAGYPFYATLASDLPDSTEVALERDGKRLASTIPLRTSDGKVSVPVTVGRGKAKLRFVVTAGGQAGQASAPITVTGRKAAGKWSTTRRDDGAYKGPGKLLTTFKVAGNGRELRNFRAQVTTFCIGGLDPTTNRLVISLAIVNSVKVAPDGRFLKSVRVSKTDIVVSGRLRKGKVTGGKVSIAYPLCSGARTFSAKRR